MFFYIQCIGCLQVISVANMGLIALAKHWPTLPAQKGEIDKNCIIKEGFEHGVFMLLFSLLYILFAGGKNVPWLVAF